MATTEAQRNIKHAFARTLIKSLVVVERYSGDKKCGGNLGFGRSCTQKAAVRVRIGTMMSWPCCGYDDDTDREGCLTQSMNSVNSQALAYLMQNSQFDEAIAELLTRDFFSDMR